MERLLLLWEESSVAATRLRAITKLGEMARSVMRHTIDSEQFSPVKRLCDPISFATWARRLMDDCIQALHPAAAGVRRTVLRQPLLMVHDNFPSSSGWHS